MSRKLILTPEQIKYIKRVAKNQNLMLMAEKIKVDYQIIKRYCEKNGIEYLNLHWREGITLTPKQKELILHLAYNTHDNNSITIAKELKLSKSSVDNYLSYHFRKQEEKFAKRKYSEINWGSLK